jgi:hypothetical protein
VPTDIVYTTCGSCGRAYNLANPEVRLDATGAFCVHCGRRSDIPAEDLDRAREVRGATGA